MGLWTVFGGSLDGLWWVFGRCGSLVGLWVGLWVGLG